MIAKKILTTMILSMTGISLLLMMSGCGDESTTTDDPEQQSEQRPAPTATLTGQFLDDLVEGLSYDCSSGRTGTTDSDGLYTCADKDTVTFSIGELTIGTVAVQTHFITPYSFYPNAEDAALRLAQVLQSLDADGDLENGIVIEAEIATLLPSDLDFADPSSEAAIETALGITLVSREQAYAHLQESIAEARGDGEENYYIPHADAGADQNIHTESTVTLDASLSTDVDGSPLTYQWELVDIPEDSNALLSDSNAVRPTFTPDVDGSYLVELIVDDGVYLSMRTTVIIIATTSNAAPVADVGDDQSVQTNSLVYLDGSRSSDVDRDELTYEWAFVSRPEGSLATLSAVRAVDPSFVADLDGDYVIALVVDDGQMKSMAVEGIVTASTLNTSPVAEAGDAQDVVVGTITTVDGDLSSDSDGDLLSYRWSLMTRPAGSLATLSESTRVNPTFVADIEGTYVLQLIVNDGSLDSRADTVVITAFIEDVRPTPLPITVPIVDLVPEPTPVVDPNPIPTPVPDQDPTTDPIPVPDDGVPDPDDDSISDPVIVPTPEPDDTPVVDPFPDPDSVVDPIHVPVIDSGNGHSDTAP